MVTTAEERQDELQVGALQVLLQDRRRLLTGLAFFLAIVAAV